MHIYLVVPVSSRLHGLSGYVLVPTDEKILKTVFSFPVVFMCQLLTLLRILYGVLLFEEQRKYLFNRIKIP